MTIVVITWLMNTFMTPIYQATATLRLTIENKGTLVGSLDPFYPLFHDEERTIETQFNILKSRSLAKRVINLLNLQNQPEFAALAEDKAKKSREEIESNMVDTFLGRLSTERIKKTDLICISFYSADRNLAQKVANVMAEEYMQFEIDCKNQSFSHIKKWLERQLTQLGSRVEGSQRKLYEYGGQGEILSPEDKDNVLVQRYIEFSGLLTKAQSERMAREAVYRQLKEKGAGASPITNNSLVQSLRQEVAKQAARVSSYKRIYLPDHPKLQAEEANLKGLQARLSNEIQDIRVSVQSDYEAARRTENLLIEALEGQKRKVGDLQKKLVQYKILKRDVETNEELYKGLLARMKEASVASTMVPSNVAVIDPAERPLYPYKPKKARNIALAFLVGLMGGVFLAFTMEYFDDSIKTAEEAERVCQLPTLGMVPQYRGNHKGLPQLETDDPGLLAYHDPKSMVADAIFVVRTAVMLSVPGGPPEAIMVTSPNPLEGKTTMATNLAIALAMSGRKVVLVDGDLRRPSVHKAFRLPYQPGLSDLLTGYLSAAEVLQPTKITNLMVIPAGPVPPNPVTLLGSAAFKEAIDYLRGEFHHIILDTPPTLNIPDSRVMSSLMDAAILVIKHHHTPREAARLARQVLSQVHAEVIGTILNQVTIQKLRYGNYYYRKYKYYYGS